MGSQQQIPLELLGDLLPQFAALVQEVAQWGKVENLKPALSDPRVRSCIATIIREYEEQAERGLPGTLKVPTQSQSRTSDSLGKGKAEVPNATPVSIGEQVRLEKCKACRCPIRHEARHRQGLQSTPEYNLGEYCTDCFRELTEGYKPWQKTFVRDGLFRQDPPIRPLGQRVGMSRTCS